MPLLLPQNLVKHLQRTNVQEGL